jgi:UDP-N-acetyl-D-mannosaminuronic acid dehydrogenase
LLAGVDSDPGLIRAARKINAEQPVRTVNTVLAACEGIDAPRVAVLGVSYKGGVGDPRMSPSTEIIAQLEAASIQVQVHDPLVTEYSSPLLDLHDSLSGADLALILVDHPQFGAIDPIEAAGLMRNRIVIDGRRMIDASSWEKSGFTVIQIGVGRA